MQDVITSLGYLCLGSRFKRLGERLQSGVAEMLDSMGHSVQPAHLPILMALASHGACSTGLLSHHVGISQPGITRAVTRLRELDLVSLKSDSSDRRQTVISLSARGTALLDELRATLFPAVERAVAQICETMEPGIIAHLERIETALDRDPFGARVRAEMA